MGEDALRNSVIFRRGRPLAVLEGYDTAQVCENGHLITNRAESAPQYRQEYCSKCGAKTITHCTHCQGKIRGHLHRSGMRETLVPKFCHHCGEPYPWTEKGIQSARDLLAEVDLLTGEELASLSDSLNDLVRDTPGTPVAVSRFKKFLPKAGREVADAFRSLIVDIASEAVKKSLWP
jgi:hypothetical protein